MGGGRRSFIPNTETDSEGSKGYRADGVNLVNKWKSLKSPNLNATYIESLNDLKNVDAGKTNALLGLFSSSHMAYYHDQEKDGDPSLTDMTEKAIEILSKNPNGFFLFVEGGRIGMKNNISNDKTRNSFIEMYLFVFIIFRSRSP